MIFLAWQIARDNNWPIAVWNIEKQAEFIFKSIDNTLKEIGSWLDDVIKAVIYLTDINDFKKVSAIRNEYFKNSKPVSTLVEINATAREWCNIEIEVTAVKSK